MSKQSKTYQCEECLEMVPALLAWRQDGPWICAPCFRGREMLRDLAAEAGIK